MSNLFIFDKISQIMILLVLSLFFLVLKFSKNYLKGDKNYQKFFIYSALLLISLITTICADNLIIFLIAWIVNNYLLVKLMAFKSDWQAAKNAAKLAGKNFLISGISLAAAFILIYANSGFLEISKSIQYLDYQSAEVNFIVIFLIITSISQSAIIPFHSWLKNSLNSITPVSALMHAGLVNGGGFLLIRFHEIFLHQNWSLNILLIIGFVSLLIASLAKLIQANYKRMLAFSTIAQMSFMIIQCGLGLFSSALIHIIWHGFFKAYLFLSSPEAAKINKEKTDLNLSKINLLLCFFSSLIAVLVFSFISNHDIFDFNSRLVILAIVFVSAFQIAASFLNKKSDTSPDNDLAKRFVKISVICSVFSTLYALSITIIEDVFMLHEISVAQPFNILHLILIVGIFILWLAVALWRVLYQKNEAIFNKIYLKLINFSATNKDCSTLHRQFYKI